MWRCKCDCGATVVVPRPFLVLGGRTSCGCGRRLDLTGQKFGKLTVLNENGRDKYGQIVWHCKCDCGMELDVKGYDLTHHKKQSCGCDNPHNLSGRKFGKLTAIMKINEPGPSKWLCKCDCGKELIIDAHSLLFHKNPSCGCSRIVDLTGKRFGMLTVLYRTEERRRGFVMWHCRCDCGNEVDVMSSNLIHGHSRSCGCRSRLMASLTHCVWKTPEEQRLAKIFNGMRARCYCKTNKNYARWGGRGIYICDEWLDPINGRRAFIDWALSHGYKLNAGLSLDRINNDGPYSPENCRFTNSETQCNNRRNNVLVNYLGIEKSCSLWDKYFGFSPGRLLNKYRVFGEEYVKSIIDAHLHGKPEPPPPQFDSRPKECQEYSKNRYTKKLERERRDRYLRKIIPSSM